MKIEILGTGCSKCQKLESNARKALEDTINDTKIDAEIVKVTDIMEIVKYGVRLTPAIAIDGVVQSYGRISTVDEIKKFLYKKIEEDKNKPYNK